MQPHRVPPPHDDTTTRAYPRANVQAATAGDRNPGHWYPHHIALPDSPGDFTPYQTPDYAERDVRPPGEWLEALADRRRRNRFSANARTPSGALSVSMTARKYCRPSSRPTRAASSLPVTTCLPVARAEPSPVLAREAGRVGLTAHQMELRLQRGGYFRSR